MPRPRRDVPWLTWRNGVAYANWYDQERGRTYKQSLDTRDAGEAARKFGEFLISGPSRGAGRATGLTVAQALDDYWTEHCGRRDDRGRPLVADPTRQENAIRHLKAHFGAAELANIGPVESRAYAQARRDGVIGGGARRTDKRGGDATIRREMHVLVAAANHAVKWGRLDRGGLPRVDLPAGEHAPEDVKWFTKEEIRELLEAAAGDLRDFILLAYYTGARRRAIEDLTRFQVDLAAGRINLMTPGKRGTKKRMPVVPIYPEIRPTVEMLMALDERLLPKRNYYRMFKDLAAKIGHENGHPHMLRHSRATHMLMDGEPIYKVARLLGDTIKTVESVYGHCLPDYLLTDSGLAEPGKEARNA